MSGNMIIDEGKDVYTILWEKSDLSKKYDFVQDLSPKLSGSDLLFHIKRIRDSKSFAVRLKVVSNSFNVLGIYGDTMRNTVMYQLAHDNIIKVVDMEIFDAMSDIYLATVTNYVDMSLYELHNDNHIWKSEYLEIAHGIISGVQYIHSRDKCHQLLHPKNILLKKHESKDEAKIDVRYKTKITDFKSIQSSEFDNRNVETLKTHIRNGVMLNYTAPELLISKIPNTCNKSADMWSVGCLLYFLMTGDHLYGTTGSSYRDTFKSLICTVGNPSKEWVDRYTDEFPYPVSPGIMNKKLALISKSVPSSLVKFMLKCLQYEDEKRPTAAHGTRLVCFRNKGFGPKNPKTSSKRSMPLPPSQITHAELRTHMMKANIKQLEKELIEKRPLIMAMYIFDRCSTLLVERPTYEDVYVLFVTCYNMACKVLDIEVTNMSFITQHLSTINKLERYIFIHLRGEFGHEYVMSLKRHADLMSTINNLVSKPSK